MVLLTVQYYYLRTSSFYNRLERRSRRRQRKLNGSGTETETCARVIHCDSYALHFRQYGTTPHSVRRTLYTYYGATLRAKILYIYDTESIRYGRYYYVPRYVCKIIIFPFSIASAIALLLLPISLATNDNGQLSITY